MPAHIIAEEGPHRGLTLNLEEGEEWIIGRDPDISDLVIDDNTVSRKHIQITKTPDGFFLKNLSRVNPSLINDEEFPKPVLLKEGDRIQVGNTTFLYSEEEIPEGAELAPQEKVKPKSAYDDIFGDIDTSAEEEEETPLPPAPEPVEQTQAEISNHSESNNSAYDTIFEEGEEELPFNMISDSPLILKVIAGPNAGAEIGIEKGRSYTIGKDQNSCDIVFQDLSVSRNHAKLEVDLNGQIKLEDLGSKNGTVVNGSVISEKQVVTPQDLISLGTTVFMIIDREAPQDTIYSPMIPSYESQKVAEEELPVLQEEAKDKRDWKREPIPTKHLIMGGSFAAIFLIVFLSFFSLFKSKSVEVAGKEPVSEIKEALDKYSDVQFSFNPGSGKLFLTGHVLTNVNYQEMKYRINQIDFILSVEDTVVIDEGVWQMMNDVISSNADWRGVSIHAPEAGKFVVSGYVPTIEEATTLSEYLTVNFPYLDRLQNQVAVEEILSTQLTSLIGAQNLGGVTFKLSNGEVVLSGMYDESRESQFNTLIKEIKHINGIHGVKNFAMGAHPNLAGINVSDQFQVTGSSSFEGHGYSVVLNGKIYTLGDFVGGMKITTIDPSTIFLEKDGLKYRIDYTR